MFCDYNKQYEEALAEMEKQWKSLDLKEGDPYWTDNDGVPRGVQVQVIRRIPGYDFFEPYKHGWRIFKTHKKNMTTEHMLNEHLFGEPGIWQEKFQKIQNYILDSAKPFYTSVQKTMKEMAEKLAERIKKLIGMKCEPYMRKKK
ncbi:unnamed protein product [Paramecium octaurelia]|uniref:Uncharacterized protein n=1 Tax=Paramecium octaurelia TaxID=43137 RepID=A0A8S1X836_PAROT|nr:unnamed protein product [Paramecium octaurelia]